MVPAHKQTLSYPLPPPEILGLWDFVIFELRGVIVLQNFIHSDLSDGSFAIDYLSAWPKIPKTITPREQKLESK